MAVIEITGSVQVALDYVFSVIPCWQRLMAGLRSHFIEASAIQAFERIQGGPDGLRLPVTVGHDSAHCLLGKGCKAQGSAVHG